MLQVYTEYCDERGTCSKRWLSADLSIDCDGAEHTGFLVYAALMIVVYPIGIPAYYARLLYAQRGVLQKLQHEEEVAASSEVLQKFGNLPAAQGGASSVATPASLKDNVYNRAKQELPTAVNRLVQSYECASAAAPPH